MKIKQEQIDAAFAAAGDNKEIIAVLESLFGKRETVKFKHYTDIKTYEDACEYLGINPLPEDCSCTFTSSVDYKPTSDEIAYAKLKIIAKAIRGGEDFSFKKAIENGKYYRPWWIVCSKKYFETQLTDEERERGFLFGGAAANGAPAGFAYARVLMRPRLRLRLSARGFASMTGSVASISASNSKNSLQSSTSSDVYNTNPNPRVTAWQLG